MRDSYLRFFSKTRITKEDFFKFGLAETIYSPLGKAETEWLELKRKIQNNEEVFIRGFGRDANGTYLYKKFYTALTGNQKIFKDPTNNAVPTKIIAELTGYAKSKRKNYELIRNYQVSHLFGKTKNIYAFAAPWNIAYIPKLIDPFTGHEAQGEFVDEFTRLFQMQAFEKFEHLILDFNSIISNTEFRQKIESSIFSLSKEPNVTEKEIEKLKKSIENEFSPILMNK